MLPYTAYLRVYEPVIAFPEPLRSVWTAYAESGRRPRRAWALGLEHEQALRRLAASPPVVAPEVESPHAYVRRLNDMIYICPWQTRLRSWLAFEDFHGRLPAATADAFVSRRQSDRLQVDFERWKLGGRTLRPHILSSTWHVPVPWFALFDQAERFLSLGSPPPGGAAGTGRESTGREGSGRRADERVERRIDERVEEREAFGGDATDPLSEWAIRRPEQEHAAGPGVFDQAKAAGQRTLSYVTTMGEARRRVDRARRAPRGNPGEGFATAQVEGVARWLAEFHPAGLVELDYGGLVRLLDDAWLRADESVAEVSVAVAAMERGEVELTVAMHKRLRARWRQVQALESAN